MATRTDELTYGDLPDDPGNDHLCCPGCAAEFSAWRGDYFWADPTEAVECGECGTPMELGHWGRRWEPAEE